MALEKDRRTLELLLMTRLSNGELVLGKLLAGMLGVLMLLAAALPFFMLTVLFGGGKGNDIFGDTWEYNTSTGWSKIK